jgi:ElaB/YqjD/DUF883 family membrane-anchored ribosome-binding protein
MSISEKRDAVSNGIHSMANDAIDKTTSAANRASEFTGQVASSLKGVGIDTDRMATVAMRQAGAFETALVETICARPIRSVAIAALAGLLIGAARGR